PGGGAFVASVPGFAEDRFRGGGGDRVAPVKAAAGATDKDRRRSAAHRQRDDEPKAVAYIVGHHRIADARVAISAGKDGQAWQRAVLPGEAAVDGGGKSDVAAPAAKHAAHLKGRYQHRAVGEDVRLDLGHVLPEFVSERVRADLQALRGRIGRGEQNARSQGGKKGKARAGRGRSHLNRAL